MRRHRTDPLSLVAGLVFVGLAVFALLGGISYDTDLDLRWLWPALLITAGFLLLAGVGRSPDEEPADDPGDPATLV